MSEVNAAEAHDANRAAWNDAAAAYTAALADRIEFLRRGGSSVHPIEREHLGILAPWCRCAIHLQCASGKDTLSLLNEGAARVVGVDISDVHIANAQAASDALGAPATWYRCDVLDTPGELDGSADLVYTGRGSLNWLHDIRAWGQVVARLLRPGGRFHVLDDHPAVFLFDSESVELRPSGADYFHHRVQTRGWTTEYIGDLGRAPAEHPVKYERVWTIADVFGALTAAGLLVDQLGEHPDEYWRSFPLLDPAARLRLPMTFSITAHRPVDRERS